MKRIILLIVLFLPTFMYAQESFTDKPGYTPHILLGVSAAVDRAESDSEIQAAGLGSERQELKESLLTQGVRVGYIFNKFARVLLDIEKSNVKNGFSYSSYLLGFDITPKLGDDSAWSLMLGFFGGMANAEFKDGNLVINNQSLGSMKFKGTSFGLKAGVLLEVGENAEFEFGVKAKRLDLGKKTGSINNGAQEIAINMSKTSTLSGYVAFNLKF